MSNSSIKKILAVAMLVAFASPSGLAVVDGYNYSSASNTLPLNADVKLTSSNNLITLSLRDSDVKQVLRMFADKAGMNIVFHSSVSGQVTLDLVNMPINQAFNLVLQVANLSFYKQNNTMIILSKDDESNKTFSKQEMMTFPIKYVGASRIADFLNKNVFSMKKPGLSGSDAATVNPVTNELIVFGMPGDIAIVQKVIDQLDREPFTKTFTVNHTTPAEMANLICNTLLPSGGVSSSDSKGGFTGGASSVSSSSSSSSSSSGGEELKLGESVVACTINSKTESGRDNLAPFDVQNLSITYFPQRGSITLMGGSAVQAEMIEKFIKEHDIKQPQAYLEVSIVELNESGSKEIQNNWQFQNNTWGFNFNGTQLSAERSSGFDRYSVGSSAATTGRFMDATEYHYQPGYVNSDGDWVNAIFSSTPIKVLMPNTTYINWSINYLIENSKGRVLANPKILITNGKESVIDLTQDYVEKVTSEFITSTSAGSGSTSGLVQRDYSIGDDLGIKVSLTPFISPDGYVTMNIKPEYSTISEKIYAASSTGVGTDLAATLLSRRDLDLKNVRIKDGETLVIGGMIQENETKTVHKIPLLGDLPVVGAAFRSTSTGKTKNELIIMITPKIINDGEGTVANSL